MNLQDKLTVYAWRQSTWDKLFQGNTLFAEIKALQFNELTPTIARIEWCQQNLQNKLAAQKWVIARAILTCAHIAQLDEYTFLSLPNLLHQLDPDYDTSIPLAKWNMLSWRTFLHAALIPLNLSAPLSSTWIWDAINSFWKTPRQVANRQRIPILLIDEKDEGITADLTIELLDDGNQALYSDPETMAFVEIKPAFRQALEKSVIILQQQFWKSNLDIRWKIERQDGRPLIILDGGSAGGAFTIGALKLFAEISEEK